jgi:hypothetical protein
MLQIRPEQMAVFDEDALKRFEDEMVAHSKEFSPMLTEVLGDEQLRLAVRDAIIRSAAYGFSFRGPIRLFIELMFLFGSGFDTDPQYPWAGKILNAPGDQMERAEELCSATLAYQQNVSGPEAVNTQKAFRDLSVRARQPQFFSSETFLPGILDEISRIFPHKTAYIGEARLKALVLEGKAEARKHRLPSTRGETLLTVLMFAFGHCCTSDPLYPWIYRTLTDERIADASARTERLQKKAMTWLDHVLAREREGAPA